MQYEATDVLSLVVLITWYCLTLDESTNPSFRQLFSTQEHLSAMFSLAGVIFCPGLFDTVQAPSAPSIFWFKSLSSTIPKKVWGIYALVLKKQGSPSLLYIGSGTSKVQGVQGRLQDYDNRNATPKYVDKALRDGYEITHKTLLAYCPIPKPADIPTFRYLVVALEATFCYIFWPMWKRDTTYSFGYYSPWPRETFEWNGLCSHNPLREKPVGEINLTPEQLETIAAESAKQRRRYTREYLHNVIGTNPEKSEHYRIIKRARLDRIRESKEFHCSICDTTCNSALALRLHNDTPRHKKKMLDGGVTGPYYCNSCNVSFKQGSNFRRHLKTKKHEEKSSIAD